MMAGALLKATVSSCLGCPAAMEECLKVSVLVEQAEF
jgi:hypothetical protein